MKNLLVSLGATVFFMAACSGGGELVIEQAEPAPEATAVVAAPTEVPTEAPTEVPTEAPTEVPTAAAILDGDYGSDPDLDALYDSCDTGDLAACDELYARSPIDSGYEAFGETCGETFDSPVVSCVIDDSDGGDGFADSGFYGSDLFLDALFDDCGAGDGQACDDLFLESPVDSFYETYAAHCGGRYPGTNLLCVDIFDGTVDLDIQLAADSYGADLGLDILWDECGAGSAEACDNLWLESPVDSTYEAYGYTCGGRDFNDATCSDILF